MHTCKFNQRLSEPNFKNIGHANMHVTVPFLACIVSAGWTSIPVLIAWLTLQSQFFPAWLLTQTYAKSWIQQRKLRGELNIHFLGQN